MLDKNKLMVKNTMYLYIRMIVSLLISLYTGRAFLEALGVDDFGIYNVVGGFVALLSVLTGTIESAARRFITFSLGKGDVDIIKRTFSTFNSLYFLIALIVFSIGECICYLLLDDILLLPEGRVEAAYFVFHCSLVSFCIDLIAIPCKALIVGHEHLNFFAIISIGESLFKLVIVWLLYVSPFDRLKTYALLLCLVSVCCRTTYTIYCNRHFKESRNLSFKVDRNIFKEAFSYSFWVIIGSSSGVLKEQGVNVIINMFSGVAMNAARGVSMRVYGVVGQFANSIGTSISPQITKSYASGNINRSIRLTFLMSKVQGVLLFLLSIPLIIEAEYVLGIWLVEVPAYSVSFTQAAMLLCVARTFHNSVIHIYLAVGKVKWVQIVSGGFMLMNLPICYYALCLGYEPVVTMYIGIVMELVCMAIVSMFLHSYIKFPVIEFLFKGVFMVVLAAILSFIAPVFVHIYMGCTLLRFILVVITSILSLVLLSYYIVLNKSERATVKNFIKNKISKKNENF